MQIYTPEVDGMSNSPVGHPPATEETLSIGELAAATDVAAATLRAWETRHGFPATSRQPGKHRRYPAATVDQVRQVMRLRSDGMTLDAAIARVASASDPGAVPTVFAAVRRAHPEVPARTVTKRTLLALSHALEDECCARASRGHLYAAFQQDRFLAGSRARWDDLARTADVAVALARTDTPSDGSTGDSASPAAGRLRVVDLPDDSPLLREWSVVCAADDHSGCLAAWELPGQDDVPDGERRFEAVWSLDPTVAHLAARAAHAAASALGAAVPPVTPLTPVDAAARQAYARAGEVMLRALTEVDRIRAARS